MGGDSAPFLRGSTCKSQDFVGELSIILRAVPCRKFLFSDCLPTQIPVPISPTESWGLQLVSDLRDCRPGQGFVLILPARQSLSAPFGLSAVLCRYRGEP